MRLRWILGVAALLVLSAIGAALVAGATGSDDEPASGSPPPQATESVSTLFSGDRDRIAAAVTPELASLLEDRQTASAVSVQLVDWVERGPYAGATAIVRDADGEGRLDVGFRRVADTWRITYAREMR